VKRFSLKIEMEKMRGLRNVSVFTPADWNRHLEWKTKKNFFRFNAKVSAWCTFEINKKSVFLFCFHYIGSAEAWFVNVIHENSLRCAVQGDGKQNKWIKLLAMSSECDELEWVRIKIVDLMSKIFIYFVECNVD
jgi:hypothetical protein